MTSLTPVKAARAKCLVCAGGKKAVRECTRGPESPDPCALHPFRMGQNPARAGIGGHPPCRSAHSCQKPPSQVTVSADKKTDPQGSTPEFNLGHPRAESEKATFPPPMLLPRRVLVKAVEAFVRELRDGGVQVEDPPGDG